MTLIAFHASDKHAHLMTDSIAYTEGAQVLGHATKRAPLDHLDAALATQGDSMWGDALTASLLLASTEAATFDQLVDLGPLAARAVRDQLEQEPGRTVGEGLAVMLGYSTRLRRFAGYVLHSLNDYEAQLHDGLFVTPMPWSGQPTDEQVRSLIEWSGGDQATCDAAEAWKAKPKLDAPQTDDQWVELARMVREERSMEPYAHVLVAGNVYLSKIKRGWQTTRKVHQFNDRGEEWLEVLKPTRHPLAVAAQQTTVA